MTRKILYLAIPAIALICLAAPAIAAEPGPAAGSDVDFLDQVVAPVSMKAGNCALANGAAEPQPKGNHNNDPPELRECGPCSESLCQGKNEGDICAVGLGLAFCFILAEPPMCSDGETYNCSCPGA